MNCFTAHFQTLFKYFFGTFHIVLSIYFVHFIRIFLPYSLQSCILLTSDAANFIPDKIILNLQPWHLTFIGFLISQKFHNFLSPTNLRKFYKFLSPHKIAGNIPRFRPPNQYDKNFTSSSPGTNRENFYKFLSLCQN